MNGFYKFTESFSQKIVILLMPNKQHRDNAEKGLRVKRDASTGKIIDRKQNGEKFKGIRKEALEKLSPTLNRLAKYDKE